MAEQTIVVNINGYWRDQQSKNLSGNQGIFFVYESKYHQTDQTVDLLRIIYIGEDINIRQRVMTGEFRTHCLRYIEPGNELCYAFATVENYYRERVAAAYINMHNPPANKECTTFPFDRTTIISTGKTALLYPVITANRSNIPRMETTLHFRQGNIIPARAIPILGEQVKPRLFASGE